MEGEIDETKVKHAFAAVKKDFSEINKRIDVLVRDISRSAKKSDGISERFDDLKDEMRKRESYLKKSLEDLNRKLDRRESFNSEIKKIHKVEVELQKFKGKVVESKEFEKEIGSLIIDMQKIEAELKRKEVLDSEIKKVNRIETELERLKGKVSGYDDVDGQIERLDAYVKDLKEKLENNIDKLKQESNKGFEKEIDAIKKEANARKLEAEKDIGNVVTEINKIEQKLGKREDYGNEIKKVQDALEELKKKGKTDEEGRDSILKEIKNIQKKSEESDPNIKRIQETLEELERKTGASKKDMQKELNELSSTIHDPKKIGLEEYKQETEDRIDELRRELENSSVAERIREDVEQLRNELEVMKNSEKSDMSRIGLETERLESTIRNMEKRLAEISEITTEPAKLRRDIEELRQELKLVKGSEKSDISQIEERLSKEIRNIERRLEERSPVESPSLRREIDELRREIRSGKGSGEIDISQIEERFANEVRDIERRFEETGVRTEESPELRRDVEELRQEIDFLKGSDTVDVSHIEDRVTRGIRNMEDQIKVLSERKSAPFTASPGVSHITELKRVVSRLESDNKKLKDEFRNKIAFNNSIYNELKRLSRKLYEDNRFIRERKSFEKKIKEYRDGKIEDFKNVLFYVLMGVGAFAAVAFYYYKNMGMVLPEISSKLIYILITIGVIGVIMFIPKNFFHGMRTGWIGVVDFLAGKK